MLRITETRSPDGVLLKLEGGFSGEWVAELDACWRAAAAAAGGAPVCVDLTDVSRVDLAGQALLARMHRAGVRFVTRGCLMRELVRDMVGS